MLTLVSRFFSIVVLAGAFSNSSQAQQVPPSVIQFQELLAESAVGSEPLVTRAFGYYTAGLCQRYFSDSETGGDSCIVRGAGILSQKSAPSNYNETAILALEFTRDFCRTVAASLQNACLVSGLLSHVSMARNSMDSSSRTAIGFNTQVVAEKASDCRFMERDYLRIRFHYPYNRRGEGECLNEVFDQLTRFYAELRMGQSASFPGNENASRLTPGR